MVKRHPPLCLLKERATRWGSRGAMKRIYNKKIVQQRRRALRSNLTLAEKVMWLSLRKRQTGGIRFLRQYSVDNFIIDFYSPELKLGIEVDGDSHIGNEEYDKYRQTLIEQHEIKIIRFSNEQIIGNPEKVLEKVKEVIGEIKRG